MKILATADWHIRDHKPRSRTDKNYRTTQYDKAKWVLDLALANSALICHGGDWFDVSNVSDVLRNIYLSLLVKYKPMVVSVGNHEQSFHRSDISSTTIGSFFACGFFLKEAPGIHTADWGEGVSDHNGVLVTHRTITEKPNSIIEGSISAKEYLEHTPYDIVISGDYHVPHTLRHNGKLLVNPGSMMRQNSDQINLKPRVYLIDTDTMECEKIYIPVEGADEVFNLKAIKDAKEKDEQTEKMKMAITDMVAEMQEGKEKPSFQKALDAVIGKVEPKESVKKVISEVAA